MKKLIQRLLLGTAFAAMPFLVGCEKDSGGDQFVSPGTADVRGTWYKHGNSGGWYGPNKEWGFGWVYVDEQNGTNVQGRYENELYEQGYDYESLSDLRGTITGNHLVMSIFNNEQSATVPIVNVTVNGNSAGRLERVSQDIVRRAKPWQE